MTVGRRSDIAGTWQLDFVFASDTIADRLTTTALNQPEQLGGSDHCQARIEVDL